MGLIPWLQYLFRAPGVARRQRNPSDAFPGVSGNPIPRRHVIDDDRAYSVSHIMILPGYLNERLVWVANPMIGLLTIRAYSRVIRSATMAFAVAA